jgi:hypothetical protein
MDLDWAGLLPALFFFARRSLVPGIAALCDQNFGAQVALNS